MGKILYLTVCVKCSCNHRKESELTLWSFVSLTDKSQHKTSAFMANFRGEGYQKFYVKLTSLKCANAATFKGFKKLNNWSDDPQNSFF